MTGFPHGLEECSGFQWDSGNAQKNWDLHKVSREEAEQMFFNRPILVAADDAHSGEEARFAALGQTNEGRRLLVIFAVRDTLVRVISVRDQSRKERSIYAQAQSQD